MSTTPEEQRKRDIISGFGDLIQQTEQLKKNFDEFIEEHQLFTVGQYPGISESVRQVYTLARICAGTETTMKKARSQTVIHFIISWWHQHFDDYDTPYELEDPTIEEIKYTTKRDVWEAIIHYKRPMTEDREPIAPDAQPNVREKLVIYSDTIGYAEVYSSEEI